MRVTISLNVQFRKHYKTSSLTLFLPRRLFLVEVLQPRSHGAPELLRLQIVRAGVMPPRACVARVT